MMKTLLTILFLCGLLATARAAESSRPNVVIILTDDQGFGELGVTGNPIVVENANGGTSAWQLTNPSYNGEIEGYAGATSVNRGGSIALYVNSNGAPFTLDLYRLGWYGGLGSRLMMSAGTLAGQAQPPCPEDSTYGLIE